MNIQKLGHSLAQAACWQSRYEADNLRQFNLSPRTLPFFLAIAHEEGISQKDLMNRLLTDKTRTTKAVNHLVESGYVRRQSNCEDNRIKGVFLTDKGREIFPQVEKILDRLDGFLSDKLSEKNLEQLIMMLDAFSSAVQQNMEKQ
jgi:DNA-binding MarR family transcriptional regulator